MSKTFKYVDSFDFPAEFGFTGSARGRDQARDQPLTPEKQGMEYGPDGNHDNTSDGTYVAKLARGGQPRRMAMPRRTKLPQPPGPSPAPGASPMAQALAAPGSPMNAPGAAMSPAAQPPVQGLGQPDGMARGGCMRHARGGRAEGGPAGPFYSNDRMADPPPSRPLAKGGRACYDNGGPADASVRRQVIRQDLRTGREDVVEDSGNQPVRTRRISAEEFNDDRPTYDRNSGNSADPTLPAGYAKGGKFIQGMHMQKGALHRQLGVPEGEKIPAGKLQAAAHSENPTLRRRAVLAETLKGMHHKEG